MARIRSTEETDDFIYRVEIKMGEPLYDKNIPNLLVFEQYIEPAGPFHSMDVTILRDGQRVRDVEFRSFDHLPGPSMSYFKFAFHENARRITNHNYLLTVILRYLI